MWLTTSSSLSTEFWAHAGRIWKSLVLALCDFDEKGLVFMYCHPVCYPTGCSNILGVTSVLHGDSFCGWQLQKLSCRLLWIDTVFCEDPLNRCCCTIL